ncbi:MAG TPA: hypothetical protein VGI14_04925 [Casimicrobiaceae bacterium]|jgi:hypothetical protein
MLRPFDAAGFARLKALPGVQCAYDGSAIGARYVGSPYRGYPLEQFGWAPAPSNLGPVVDSVAFWSDKSIRFDRPTKTPGNASGYVYFRLPKQYGVRSTFCNIFGVMWDDAMCNTAWRGSGGGFAGGFKFFDVGTGYQTKPSNAFLSYYQTGDPRTSTRTKIVKQSLGRTGAMQVYVGEAGSTFPTTIPNNPNGQPQNEGLREYLPPDGTSTQNMLFQNCIRTSDYKSLIKQGGYATIRPAGFDCMQPGVRTLFKETCEIGDRVGPNLDAWDVHYRAWIWRETESAPVQLIDWHPGVRGYFPFPCGPVAANELIGTAYIFPYCTDLDPTFDHPLAQVWYNGLIHADQDIDWTTEGTDMADAATVYTKSLAAFDEAATFNNQPTVEALNAQITALQAQLAAAQTATAPLQAQIDALTAKITKAQADLA